MSQMSLPAPTGTHPVGTTSLHLRDVSRADTWVAGVNARELMISVWYPAATPSTHRAGYLTPTESDLLLQGAGSGGLPRDVLSMVRTNAFVDAPPVGQRRSLPLVVLSPGFTKPRATLTALAEDLASNGSVVVAIDHTYENVATTFPDGRVTTCTAGEGIVHDPAFWRKLVRGRAVDVSFVLDELTGDDPKWTDAWLIDPSRIAMVGHSAGGASTIAAMLADSRIHAGIDIDGSTDDAIPDGGLSRPFLFLGRQAQYDPETGTPAAAGWEREWPRLTGWKRWLVVAGAAHHSFTDLAPLADQLGISLSTELPGDRSLQITRSYVRAFVDLHLRHRPQPLLTRPSTCYPEVTFCSPGTRTR
ncbi:alpha/beta hydrolase [Saccharomonospora sp. NPDC046836]|uniref:alpha/beta hydrolase family protein n=1 Tax=Saccharomonospora sp. NPDC046836 TaxID=3156921 RepID=UPI0033FE7713